MGRSKQVTETPPTGFNDSNKGCKPKRRLPGGRDFFLGHDVMMGLGFTGVSLKRLLLVAKLLNLV